MSLSLSSNLEKLSRSKRPLVSRRSLIRTSIKPSIKMPVKTRVMTPVKTMKASRLPKYSAGSAMVEFALLLGVLLPVGMGVAMVGKLSDLSHTTHQASRYAAWEATVYSRAELAHGVNPLWGSAGTYQGRLRGLSSVSRDTQQRVLPRYEFDTGAARFSDAIGSIVSGSADRLASLTGNNWGLPADGLLRSGIEVAVEPTPFLPGTQAPCGAAHAGATPSNATTPQPNNATPQRVCIRSTGVILADGWAASGDAQAASRVRSLVPASIMSDVGDGVSALLGNTLFPELDPLDDAFGFVNMRVLPEYAKP